MKYFLVLAVVAAALVACVTTRQSTDVTVHHGSGVYDANELVKTADKYLLSQGVWTEPKWDEKSKRWEDNYTGVRVDFYLEDADKLATVTFRQTAEAGIVVKIDKQGRPTGYERVTFR